MGVSVLVTANHYVLDVILGGLILTIGMVVVILAERIASPHWSRDRHAAPLSDRHGPVILRNEGSPS